MASALLVLVCGSLTARAAEATRPLMVYTPHGPEILKAALDELKKQNPDAKVEWQFLGAEELLTRLKAERAAPAADVWWGGPNFTFIEAAREGLLSPYKPTWSAVAPDGTHDAGDLWYADLQTPLTIIRNAQLVAEKDAPKDWDDLLDARFAGKIAIRYPMDSGTMRGLFAALIAAKAKPPGTLAKAFEWLGSLEKQIGAYTGHSQELFQLLGKGLYTVGLWNAPETAMRQEQGFPVTVVFPRSGMPVLLDAIAMVKRPEAHPLAAKFYETVTSAAFERVLAAQPFNRIPVREDLSAVRPAFLKDPRYRAMPVDWNDVSLHAGAWMTQWETQIAVPGKKR
jgi:iron(III) transport system substrate-binding protein